MLDNKFSKNRKVLNGSAVISSKIASFFIVFLIIICLFPVRVNAEAATYVTIPANTKIMVSKKGDGSAGGNGYEYYYELTADARVFYMKREFNSQNVPYFIAVGTENCTYKYYEYTGGHYTLRGEGSKNVESDGYWVLTSTVVSYNGYNRNDEFPYIDEYYSRDRAIYYTFGDGAVGETPNWGNVADVNISTIYSGNVTNSPTNIDKFTWNNEYTTSGMSIISNITDHPVVQIQAVPVTWKTSTREEMENQTGADATIGTGVVLDSYNARTGYLQVTWQEVIDYLQIEYANIYSYFFDGEYWIMKGWFYQIRLVADGYEGEWITLSNGLNLSPKKSKKLIEDPYDENIYNLLKEISETNNQITTVYEYGDNNYITINNDPSSGWQDPDGGGSFWDFLASVVKAISDGIASIVSSIASLVGDLVNGILGLFTFDTFEINNYNTEVQTLKENSGIFGQSIEFADSIKDSIRGVEQQPAVLHFDGIVIDNVQLIPAVDLDFDQMVVDAGLTDFHNLVYVFTDGTILISLIIMVHRKLMEVLRK